MREEKQKLISAIFDALDKYRVIYGSDDFANLFDGIVEYYYSVETHDKRMEYMTYMNKFLALKAAIDEI